MAKFIGPAHADNSAVGIGHRPPIPLILCGKMFSVESRLPASKTGG